MRDFDNALGFQSEARLIFKGICGGIYNAEVGNGVFPKLKHHWILGADFQSNGN